MSWSTFVEITGFIIIFHAIGLLRDVIGDECYLDRQAENDEEDS